MFTKQHFDPLAKFLRREGITQKQANDYLYAKHAVERNRIIGGALYGQMLPGGIENGVWDNAQRLATMHSALQQGRSPQQAALMARDATIDYQLRGNWSNIMSLWEPFFNTAGTENRIPSRRRDQSF
jgi:hypothetical protein